VPSIVPDYAGWPQYFVLCDYGPEHGLAWSEVDPAKADRLTIVQWLVHGVFADPMTVMEVDLPAGICRDVTAEIMAEVEARLAA